MPEPSDKSVPQVVTELWELTKDYARQETVDPIKGLGRYVGYGLLGALLGSLGVLLLLLALLRALQTETGEWLDGTLSFVPYVVVFAVGLVLIAVVAARMNRSGDGS